MTKKKYFISDDVYKGQKPIKFSLTELCKGNEPDLCKWTKKSKVGNKNKSKWNGSTITRVE